MARFTPAKVACQDIDKVHGNEGKAADTEEAALLATEDHGEENGLAEVEALVLPDTENSTNELEDAC